jgi:hypothetical protein
MCDAPGGEEHAGLIGTTEREASTSHMVAIGREASVRLTDTAQVHMKVNEEAGIVLVDGAPDGSIRRGFTVNGLKKNVSTYAETGRPNRQILDVRCPGLPRSDPTAKKGTSVTATVSVDE